MDTNNKSELNNHLTGLIRQAPEETVEVVTDFARATLLLGPEQTRDCFDGALLKYMALVASKDHLPSYYKGEYLDKRIREAKKEAQLQIKELVETYVESKHSQDERYQSWKKNRDSP